MIYGRSVEPEEKGLQGMVVATLPWGGTRHIVFLGDGGPLYLVPAHFFHATEEQMAHMTKSQRRNRTESPFNVGSLVEIGVDEGSNVLAWILKVPMTATDFSSLSYEGGYSYLDVDAVTNGNILWASKNLGDITEKLGQRRDELDRFPANVPLKVRLEIHLHYGDYEDTQCIPTSDFEPSYTLVYRKMWVNQQDGSATEIVAEAPWNKRASPPEPSPTHNVASFESSPSLRSGSSSGTTSSGTTLSGTMSSDTTSSGSGMSSKSSSSRSGSSSGTRHSCSGTPSKSKNSAALPASREPASRPQAIDISGDEGEDGYTNPDAEEVIDISGDEGEDGYTNPDAEEVIDISGDEGEDGETSPEVEEVMDISGDEGEDGDTRPEVEEVIDTYDDEEMDSETPRDYHRG